MRPLFDERGMNEEFGINCFVLISAPRPDETGTPRRLAEDIQDAAQFSFNTFHQSVESTEQFFEYLRYLVDVCRDGVRPFLHLDSHGDKDGGFEIGHTREVIPRTKLCAGLREVNRSVDNNLAVLTTSCWGYNAIRAITLKELTPFRFLIAPTEVISVGEIWELAPRFYHRLVTGEELRAACKELGPKYRQYTASAVFLNAMANHYRDFGIGSAGRRAREDLLTDALAHPGISKDRHTRQRLRKRIAELCMPSQQDVEERARVFMGDKHPPFTVVDVRNYIKRLPPKRA